MNLRFFSLPLLACSVVAAAFSAEPSHVTVKVNRPKITHHEFDPRHPPRTMPHLTPPESGVCHYEFTVDTAISCFVEQKDPHTVDAEVDTIDVILDLPIDIWVMRNAPAKLRQHEEGHRQIAEDYYRDGGAAARAIAEKMIGRKAIGHGRNKAEAQAAAQQKLMDDFSNAYLLATRVPCRICEDHYDDITTHGLKPIGEAEAIAQAKTLQAAGKLPSTGAPKWDPIITPVR